jgi:hypothetical protein
VPLRKITSQSFDAILSVLGDDPVIQSPAHLAAEPDLSPRQQKNPAPQVAQAEAQNSLGLKPPSQMRSSLTTSANLVPSLIGLLCICTLAWMLYALNALDQASRAQFQALESKTLALKQTLAEQEDALATHQEELIERLENIQATALAAANRNAKAAHHPLRQETLERERTMKAQEANLSRWQYLGISKTGQGVSAFFHTGEKTIILALNSSVLGTWVLTEAGADYAKITAATGKVIILKLKRLP